MARSEEAEAFFYAVYQAIQEIPYGKVTSYAHIARLVGTRACCIFLVFPTHLFPIFPCQARNFFYFLSSWFLA